MPPSPTSRQKLIVFAHTPPPVHGQSVMVATLVHGLRSNPAFDLQHVNVRLSTDATDIGRWRPGKIFPLLAACLDALRRRGRNRRCTFYYVPAPGKRSALWRDLVVMFLCRPFFHRLVLHWHAVGLGHWLATQATRPERVAARWLLGGADLALILAPEFGADAQMFSPRRVAVVSNCVPDPGVLAERPSTTCRKRCSVLFLGQCSRAKGFFDTLDAIEIAEYAAPGTFQLVLAGGFASKVEESEYHARVASMPPDLVRYVGFADDERKHTLFSDADVFCFPTVYPHEGQPLVLIEALAHDVPIITTRWRAIPGMLPSEHVWFVSAGNPSELAEALANARVAPRPKGALRRHYLAHFTPEQHLAQLQTALLSADR